MDSFFGIGLAELFFIAVIALVVLGPKRLPETMRQVARAWGQVRNLTRELTAQFSEEIKTLEELNPQNLLKELADDLEGNAKPAKPTTAKANALKPASTRATMPTTTAQGVKPTPAQPKSATIAAKPAKSSEATAPEAVGALQSVDHTG